MCYCQEMMDAFISALDAAIQDEFDVAAQVSDEEWEAIRPNKIQRRDMLLKHMQVERVKMSMSSAPRDSNIMFVLLSATRS